MTTLRRSPLRLSFGAAVAVTLVGTACDLHEPQGRPGIDPGESSYNSSATSAVVGSSTDAAASSGSDAQGSGGDGGQGSGGTSAQGGLGGDLPDGPFLVAPSSFVDVGGRVQLRILEELDDGSRAEITGDAALASLTPDVLTFDQGLALGISGGTATVRIVHDGRDALGTVRVRHWTRLGAFPEPGSAAAVRAVGYDGSLLQGSWRDTDLEPVIWYAAPDDATWQRVADERPMSTAVPVSGGRHLVTRPTEYPQEIDTDDIAEMLGPDLVFAEPDPPIAPLRDARWAIPYGFGQCALIAYDSGRAIRRWCDGGETADVDWPRGVLARASIHVDEAGRIGILEENDNGEPARALVEDGRGGWDVLVLGTDAWFYSTMTMGPDGQGWVAWSTDPYGTGVTAARITPDGFEEPALVSEIGTLVQLTTLPDGRGVLVWEESSPPGNALTHGGLVIPDGAASDADGALFGGAGGLASVYDFFGDPTEDVWATDGVSWFISHSIETCDETGGGLVGGTPGGGFVYARTCGGDLVVDAYR